MPVLWPQILQNRGRALWQNQALEIKVDCYCLENPSKLKSKIAGRISSLLKSTVARNELNVSLYYYNFIQCCFQFRICNNNQCDYIFNSYFKLTLFINFLFLRENKVLFLVNQLFKLKLILSTLYLLCLQIIFSY